MRKTPEYGVESLCEFKYADIREYIKRIRSYDVVIYASVGNVLGNPLDCVGKLRKCIRFEGYMLIADGYLPHDETLSQYLSQIKESYVT